jgi:hypothetical protein
VIKPPPHKAEQSECNNPHKKDREMPSPVSAEIATALDNPIVLRADLIFQPSILFKAVRIGMLSALISVSVCRLL